jgi:hypothetical protein
MNVETLRTLFGMLPQDAHVQFVYDGQFVGDVEFVIMVNDQVRLLSRMQDAGFHPIVKIDQKH